MRWEAWVAEAHGEPDEGRGDAHRRWVRCAVNAVLVITFGVLAARFALLLFASSAPTHGVEADGAPAGHRLPAGATTTTETQP